MEDTPHQPIAPKTLDELQSLVRENTAIHPTAAFEIPHSKFKIQNSRISLAAFNNIVEYQPEEYTITVEAGALVSDIQAILAEKNQYLPFDPPFAQNGATIGSMIANGYSGPGAYRYGILRDFILGVSFVDGLGDLIKTGGKVVKNAAGFDIPKLMVGSCGSLGVITEATFKIFPKSPATRSIVFKFSSFSESHAALLKLGRSHFTPDSIELNTGGHLFIRLTGQAASMDQRVQALESLLGERPETQSEADAFDSWDSSVNLRDFPATGILVKIATTPTGIASLNNAIAPHSANLRYSIGGFATWIHWDNDISDLSEILQTLNLSAQVVQGDTPSRIIGITHQQPFYQRVKQALDPEGKFSDPYRRTEPRQVRGHDRFSLPRQ